MLERELEVAREAARCAGAIVAAYGEQTELEHWDKAQGSPVTAADLEANAAIERILRESFPDDPILSEETADASGRRSAERVWIVDPLDGTKELIAGIPEYAVSVALSLCGAPALGCVYCPATGECFWSARGSGAFVDGAPLHVSSVERLSDATLLASRTETKKGQVESWTPLFASVRPTGSAALKLALVACGRADLWVSTAPKNEWDVCAGDAILREAGGSFVSVAQGARRYNQERLLLEPPLIAGPPHLVRELSEWSRARVAGSRSG